VSTAAQAAEAVTSIGQQQAENERRFSRISMASVDYTLPSAPLSSAPFTFMAGNAP
jgi:hypothetical protein